MLIPLIKSATESGFTLIEISIVLIIIGLIVGSISIGMDLINAAAVRAQISQVEKYQTAVRTFQYKYGNFPGDIPDPLASNFGFQARGQFAGEGDGNDIIESDCNNTANNSDGFQAGCGELAVFWQDLSVANLIDTYVPSGGNGYPHANGQSNGTVNLTSSPHAVKDWLPTAKIGQGNFIYIHSLNSTNYFTLSTVTDIGWNIELTANPGLTVQQAYNIDRKIDDGLPQSGAVTTCYMNKDVAGDRVVWAAGGLVQGAPGASNCVATTSATPPETTDCYGNNNIAGAMYYSLNQNANVQNCALSFRF